VYDYCDLKVSVLENQWRKRLLEVYKKRGFKIETIKGMEVLNA
jgi:acetolactate synthase regulatory subunit